MMLSIFAMTTIAIVCCRSVLAETPKPQPKPDEELSKAIATVLKAMNTNLPEA